MTDDAVSITCMYIFLKVGIHIIVVILNVVASTPLYDNFLREEKFLQ